MGGEGGRSGGHGMSNVAMMVDDGSKLNLKLAFDEIDRMRYWSTEGNESEKTRTKRKRKRSAGAKDEGEDEIERRTRSSCYKNSHASSSYRSSQKMSPKRQSPPISFRHTLPNSYSLHPPNRIWLCQPTPPSVEQPTTRLPQSSEHQPVGSRPPDCWDGGSNVKTSNTMRLHGCFERSSSGEATRSKRGRRSRLEQGFGEIERVSEG